MQLSVKALAVLRNFASINPSIVIKAGSTLRTISATKTIMAKADVPDTFAKTFAIYNLPQFLACMAMFEKPELEFDYEKNRVRVSSNNKSVVYHFADLSVVKAAPEKDIELPSIDAEFKLTNSDVVSVLKALGVLSLPEVAVVGDGDSITIKAINTSEQSSNHYGVVVGATDKSFSAIFNAENLKMIPDDYNVTMCSKGLAKFAGNEATYWIALESTSQFSK